MNKITCQACNGTGNDSGEESGCSCCGGYGIVASTGKCDGCGREFWERPGCRTVYSGKRYRSLDGLTFIVGDDLKSRCIHCVMGGT